MELRPGPHWGVYSPTSWIFGRERSGEGGEEKGYRGEGRRKRKGRRGKGQTPFEKTNLTMALLLPFLVTYFMTCWAILSYLTALISIYVQNLAVIMEEIGSLTVARTKFFNTLYVYNCVRSPGHVLEFSRRKGALFHCCGCKRNRKSRCIKVINGAIVPSAKHPEDDHHPRCQPVDQSGSML